jgi:A/G-specific adenine glycosylase
VSLAAIPDPAIRPGAAPDVARPDAPLGSIHDAVLGWYASNGRDLAFRRTTDPWAVLVSEVMAQQTQAARAAEHWTRFMAEFSTPAALADASPATVIRAWRGLGYNRRAIALRATAVKIVEEHDGRVPDSLEALVALPGVGPYTARAILAFAFDRSVAPLDTNIRRVLDRALGPLPAKAKALQATADGLVPASDSAAWSHALMDLGATVCGPREPRCDACPIRAWCRASAGQSAEATGLTAAGPQPTRRSPTPRFPTTTRWLRGRILDRLRDAPDQAWVTFTGPVGEHALDSVLLQIDRLSRDGMLELGNRPGSCRLVTSR